MDQFGNQIEISEAKLAIQVMEIQIIDLYSNVFRSLYFCALVALDYLPRKLKIINITSRVYDYMVELNWDVEGKEFFSHLSFLVTRYDRKAKLIIGFSKLILY